MTLEEAIKVLATIYDDIDYGHHDDDLIAIKLGIEALKRCKLVAEGYQYWHERPLPGETTLQKDDCVKDDIYFTRQPRRRARVSGSKRL